VIPSPIPINAPPETLAHDLTTSLWRERATLRLLVRRKAREPSIDYCRDMAGRVLEYLKGRGVLRVIRKIGTYETYWFGEIVSAVEMKPDIGPPFGEVRV
jgi:hypothetical protein